MLVFLCNIFECCQGFDEDVAVTNIALLLEENPSIAGESSALLPLGSNCFRSLQY